MHQEITPALSPKAAANSLSILSDIIHFMKYAKVIPEERRKETFEESVGRYVDMMKRRFPFISDEIDYYAQAIYKRQVLPSMRMLQFAGKAVETNHNRGYNCRYLPIDHPDAFHETMYLLLCGNGVGYSVQWRHLDKLPVINKRSDVDYFPIEDSIEGWALSIKAMMYWAFGLGPKPSFDYSLIRPKGSLIKTAGGIAPGPEALKAAHHEIMCILEAYPDGQKLTPLIVHDILCHFSNAVLAGGTRRAAMISLFDLDDEEMIDCKSNYAITDWQYLYRDKSGNNVVSLEYVETDSYGRMETWRTLELSDYDFASMKQSGTLHWYFFHPQRSRANNSAVLHRAHTKKTQFWDLWRRIQNSGSGDPGMYWTNDYDLGTNPCVETSLSAYSACNLTEIDISSAANQKEFEYLCEAASFFGTLQASFTDFDPRVLRSCWREATEKEALLGVGLTGLASYADISSELDLEAGANVVVYINKKFAKIIGIRPAARTTVVKPSGTASIVMKTSSGIHPWYSPYYIRHVRVGKDEPIYTYLLNSHPELVEDCFGSEATMAVIKVPVKAPSGATVACFKPTGKDELIKSESALHFASRVSHVYNKWIKPGHNYGANTHNVSCTVYLADDEWMPMFKWLWDNKMDYTGITVFPFSSHTYKQAPFEPCSKQEYERMVGRLHGIDLRDVVVEYQDNFTTEAACAGGACEII